MTRLSVLGSLVVWSLLGDAVSLVLGFKNTQSQSLEPVKRTLCGKVFAGVVKLGIFKEEITLDYLAGPSLPFYISL